MPVLLIFFILRIPSAVAQVSYYKISAGFEFGFTQYFGDVHTGTKFGPAMVSCFRYQPVRKANLGVDIQHGRILGGDSLTDPNGRFFSNRYTLFLFAAEWQMVHGVYLGGGIGALVNDIRKINRTRVLNSGRQYIFPGVDKSIDRAIQLTIGAGHFFKDQWRMNRGSLRVNYRFLFTNGDDLDGYNDPPVIFHNRNSDSFSMATLGFTWFFGGVGW